MFLGHKRIWLINERGYDARDNGYYFFKYIVKNHPEINCYYAINKKSSDFKNVSQYKNIVEFGSLKHIFLFSCAKAKISSQVNGFAPNKYYAKFMLKHHLQGKNIGLKHGIFKNIHHNYFKKNSHLDLLICGAKPEYEFIKNNFGYKESEVAYCGLARFDGLFNTCETKQILIMPTFRIPLAGLTEEDFSKTDYFVKWDDLLKKINSLISNDIKIVFYIHAVFQKYIHLFENRYDKIVIAKFEKYDVQELLKQSSLLITDYSSVFFDFAYMEKPVVFYQFDEDFYYSEHYQKGYFDYRTDGFGPVFTLSNEVVDELIKEINNNFYVCDTYLGRIKAFYELRDKNNCERIYQSILNIL